MFASKVARVFNHICGRPSLINLQKNIPYVVNKPIQYAGLRTGSKLIQEAQNLQIKKEDKSLVKDPVQNDVISKVNQQLKDNSAGKLFAIVHLAGKQFRVVAGDIIIVEGYWPPENGDVLNLDKVLLAGGSDFSLIGRPLITPGLVKVKATVIEKTLSHTKTHFRKKRRKQYMRINFVRVQHTMLRINSVEIQGKVNEIKEDSSNRIF